MKLLCKAIGITLLIICALTCEAAAVGYEQYDTPQQFRNRKLELVERDARRSETFVKETVPAYLDSGAGYVADILGVLGLPNSGSSK